MFVLVFVFLFSIVEIVKTDNELPKNYTGHQVWRVHLNDMEGAKKLHKIFRHQGREDLLRTSFKDIDVLLGEDEKAQMADLLRDGNFSYSVLHNDVQKEIEREAEMNRRARRYAGERWYERYRNWEFYYPNSKEVVDFMYDIAVTNPSICNLTSIGTTVYYREIKLLSISNGKEGNYKVLIESGSHGRDWTGVVGVLYTIQRIIDNWNISELYRNHDWYFIPVLNPDGYEYSHTKDRMWRKNRHPLSYRCTGVDINRNYETPQWCEFDTSHDYCGTNYCGAAPFSERESQAVKKLAKDKRFFIYVAIHATGTSISYPWFWSGEPSSHTPTHAYVATAMVKAINLNQNDYEYMHGYINELGAMHMSGTSTDWMYGPGNTVHSYLIDAGGPRFFLKSPKQINTAARIIYLAIEAMIQLSVE